MREIKEFILTNKDYAILTTALLQCLWDDETLVPQLRRKLSRASVVPSHQIPSTVVTMNSRVSFRVNDGREDTRVIIPDEADRLIGMTLPVTSKRGLALLGMSEGQTVTLKEPGGRSDTITVLEVTYQPEAVANRQDGDAKRSRPTDPVQRPHLRLIHNSDDDNRRSLEPK